MPIITLSGPVNNQAVILNCPPMQRITSFNVINPGGTRWRLWITDRQTHGYYYIFDVNAQTAYQGNWGVPVSRPIDIALHSLVGLQDGVNVSVTINYF